MMSRKENRSNSEPSIPQKKLPSVNTPSTSRAKALISGFTPWLGGVFQGLDLSAMQFLLIICAMYLVLGCFLESMSMLLLTLPIVFPLVVSYGIDPIWFGVLIVTLIEVALITPPVGMNVYMLASQIPSVPLNVVFRGASAFVAADVIRLGILLAVPAIALWLPSIT
jgi:TRAP-type C4-dicarboxylate transport system permease large subunit